MIVVSVTWDVVDLSNNGVEAPPSDSEDQGKDPENTTELRGGGCCCWLLRQCD